MCSLLLSFLLHEVDIGLLDAIDALCLRLGVVNVDAKPRAWPGFVTLEDNLERK